ncbi:unnamed protein product [Ectocarpus sp. 13 AM-2016]
MGSRVRTHLSTVILCLSPVPYNIISHFLGHVAESHPGPSSTNTRQLSNRVEREGFIRPTQPDVGGGTPFLIPRHIPKQSIAFEPDAKLQQPAQPCIFLHNARAMLCENMLPGKGKTNNAKIMNKEGGIGGKVFKYRL